MPASELRAGGGSPATAAAAAAFQVPTSPLSFSAAFGPVFSSFFRSCVSEGNPRTAAVRGQTTGEREEQGAEGEDEGGERRNGGANWILWAQVVSMRLLESPCGAR